MWDEIFSENGFAYGTAPNDFLVDAANQIPAGPVLCLAEGEGRNAVFLAKRGHDVTAVDGSKVGLDKAQELARREGVKLDTVVQDLEHFVPEPGGYAGIVSIWAHLPPSIRQPLHAHCVRALQPGGVFVLEAYTPAQIGRGTGGPPIPELTMSEASLREELRGLEVLSVRECIRTVGEGRLHNGESAVVQFIAQAPH